MPLVTVTRKLDRFHGPKEISPPPGNGATIFPAGSWNVEAEDAGQDPGGQGAEVVTIGDTPDDLRCSSTGSGPVLYPEGVAAVIDAH
nr:hypothetical protein [Geobacter sulfurreducens]